MCDKHKVDIFQLEEILKIEPLEQVPVPVIKIPSIPRHKASEVNGLHWICGFIAKRMRNVQPDIGAYAKG